MRTNVFWVGGPWHGRLGILPRPRGGHWLEDEARSWRDADIDLVVSLLEHDEEAQLNLEGEASAASGHGIEFRRFPIPDRGVPASREALEEVAGEIVNALDAGKNVAVHCRQGIGRSSMVVASAFLSSGENLEDALKSIKASRGLDVPETQEQRHWLNEFASWLGERKPASQGPGNRRISGR